MKIFFDTEFTGLQQNTSLISIGLISEDRRVFYAELTDHNADQCNDWIKENVIKHLIFRQLDSEKSYVPNYHIGTRELIRDALANWFRQFDYIELVSDVCHYDMVLLINLFGTAFDLPRHIAPCCYDINQDIAQYYKISQQKAFDKDREAILWEKYKEKAITGEKHNALYDAQVIREVYQIVKHVNFDKD